MEAAQDISDPEIPAASSSKQEELLNELDVLSEKLLIVHDTAALTNIAAGIRFVSASLREELIKKEKEIETLPTAISDNKSFSIVDENSSMLMNNSYIWIINNFKESALHKEAVSPEFNVFPVGYRMQCKFIFGDEDIGYHLWLKEGENDAFLKWPFTIPIQVSLINQVNDTEHVLHIITPNPEDEAQSGIWTRPHTEQPNGAFHVTSFINKNVLQGPHGCNTSTFLRNDRVYIQIKLVHDENVKEITSRERSTAENAAFDGKNVYKFLREDFLEKVQGNIFLCAIENFEFQVKNEGRFLSDSFYTAVTGYRMQGLVRVNGEDVGIFIKIIKGDYDNCLKWPFEGEINIGIINQVDETSNFMTVFTPEPNDSSQAGQWVQPYDDDNRNFYGDHEFITTTVLCGGKDFVSEYLRNDRVILKVEIL